MGLINGDTRSLDYGSHQDLGSNRASPAFKDRLRFRASGFTRWDPKNIMRVLWVIIQIGKQRFTSGG